MKATGDLLAALEERFRGVKRADLPLGARLSIVADAVRTLSPNFTHNVDQFVDRLKQVEAGVRAPVVGETMPGFMLPDSEGHFRTLDEILAGGPAIVVFYRGHWCPYCRLTISALAQIAPEVAPCRIVCITAERGEFAQAIRLEAGADFPILCDMDNGYAMSLNLAVWVDDAMSTLIEGAGWSVPEYQGTSGWVLTIPAVFVVDRTGLIVARHVDPDYRKRMELDDLVAASRLVR